MQVSGQTVAQFAQPVQFSGDAIKAKLYPLLLTSLAKAMVFVGQLARHTPHPLHFSESTTIAPFNAIFTNSLIYKFLQMYIIISQKATNRNKNAAII